MAEMWRRRRHRLAAYQNAEWTAMRWRRRLLSAAKGDIIAALQRRWRIRKRGDSE